MIKKSLTIINKLGLHARAAAKLATLAGRFASTITITCNNKTVDCKSVMSLMLLAASKGSVVELSTEGSDETSAFHEIEQLINNRFDEEE